MGSVWLMAANITVSATVAIFSLVVKNRNIWQLIHLLGVMWQLLLVTLLVGFRKGSCIVSFNIV